MPPKYTVEPNPDGTVNLVDRQGELKVVTQQQAAQLISQGNHKPLSPQRMVELQWEQQQREKHAAERKEAAKHPWKAAGLAALSGFSFGGSDLALDKSHVIPARELRQYRETNPWASIGGELGGSLVPLTYAARGAQFLGKAVVRGTKMVDELRTLTKVAEEVPRAIKAGHAVRLTKTAESLAEATKAVKALDAAKGVEEVARLSPLAQTAEKATELGRALSKAKDAPSKALLKALGRDASKLSKALEKSALKATYPSALKRGAMNLAGGLTREGIVGTTIAAQHTGGKLARGERPKPIEFVTEAALNTAFGGTLSLMGGAAGKIYSFVTDKLATSNLERLVTEAAGPSKKYASKVKEAYKASVGALREEGAKALARGNTLEVAQKAVAVERPQIVVLGNRLLLGGTLRDLGAYPELSVLADRGVRAPLSTAAVAEAMRTKISPEALGEALAREETLRAMSKLPKELLKLKTTLSSKETRALLQLPNQTSAMYKDTLKAYEKYAQLANKVMVAKQKIALTAHPPEDVLRQKMLDSLVGLLREEPELGVALHKLNLASDLPLEAFKGAGKVDLVDPAILGKALAWRNLYISTKGVVPKRSPKEIKEIVRLIAKGVLSPDDPVIKKTLKSLQDVAATHGLMSTAPEKAKDLMGSEYKQSLARREIKRLSKKIKKYQAENVITPLRAKKLREGSLTRLGRAVKNFLKSEEGSLKIDKISRLFKGEKSLVAEKKSSSLAPIGDIDEPSMIALARNIGAKDYSDLLLKMKMTPAKALDDGLDLVAVYRDAGDWSIRTPTGGWEVESPALYATKQETAKKMFLDDIRRTMLKLETKPGFKSGQIALGIDKELNDFLLKGPLNQVAEWKNAKNLIKAVRLRGKIKAIPSELFTQGNVEEIYRAGELLEKLDDVQLMKMAKAGKLQGLPLADMNERILDSLTVGKLTPVAERPSDSVIEAFIEERLGGSNPPPPHAARIPEIIANEFKSLPSVNMEGARGESFRDILGKAGTDIAPEQGGTLSSLWGNVAGGPVNNAVNIEAKDQLSGDVLAALRKQSLGGLKTEKKPNDAGFFIPGAPINAAAAAGKKAKALYEALYAKVNPKGAALKARLKKANILEPIKSPEEFTQAQAELKLLKEAQKRFYSAEGYDLAKAFSSKLGYVGAGIGGLSGYSHGISSAIIGAAGAGLVGKFFAEPLINALVDKGLLNAVVRAGKWSARNLGGHGRRALQEAYSKKEDTPLLKRLVRKGDTLSVTKFLNDKLHILTVYDDLRSVTPEEVHDYAYLGAINEGGASPDKAEEIAREVKRKVAFLQAAFERKVQGRNLSDGTHTSLKRLYLAANEPAIIVKHIVSGKTTPEDIEVLKALLPEAYQSLSKTAKYLRDSGKKLDSKTKRVIQLLLPPNKNTPIIQQAFTSKPNKAGRQLSGPTMTTGSQDMKPGR